MLDIEYASACRAASGCRVPEDLESFRNGTKRFYRWLKDPDDGEYAPEVMELVKVAEWSQDRAFVSMLYDLGGRAGECGR